MDVLSYMEEIPICVGYELDGKVVRDFPFPSKLDRAKPVYITMPGWCCDISGIRSYAELPIEARNYVEFVEKEIECRISFVSVGAARDEIIYR